MHPLQSVRALTDQPRIGVVGATGAVGTTTLTVLSERGYTDVRAFASARSAGKHVRFGDHDLEVEEATPDALAVGDLDLCLFSVGTTASRQLVPHASSGGAISVDKSSAYRLIDGYPLVVPEVNGERALDALERDRVVANPNCCTIPLTCVLKPLHTAAGLRRVRVATYQSASGAGAERMAALEAEPPRAHDLRMDWSWVGDESDEEAKLRDETRKILELPELPISATCVRVPILVGHAEAVWIEIEDRLEADQAAAVLRAAPGVRVVDLPDYPRPGETTRADDVLVGRIRRDRATPNGLTLFLACDNLRKGAAVNAVQIAEVLLAGQARRAQTPRALQR